MSVKYLLSWRVLAACMMVGAVPAGATMISHWTLDESSSPYANGGPNGGAMSQDPGTDAASSAAGFAGSAAHLQFSGGTSTRITSASDPQSGNSFGFSLFVNPQFVNAGDMFMAAEATGGSISRGFDLWDWSVRAVSVGGGLGVEFIVRGQGGGANEGFAARTSGEIMASGGGQSGDWLHLAGGYDASSGAISLFTRDMTDDPIATEYSGGGDAGMTTHGAGLSLGTIAYNGSYVNFAANTLVDDVRVFDAPLSAGEVAALELVPEPSTALLVGLGGILAVRLFRRKSDT